MKASVALVAGTRPEVLKLAPVLRSMRRSVPCHFVAIGQQAELVKKHLAELGIGSSVPIYAWKNKQLGSSLAFALGACDQALDDLKPTVVVVQGDTLTALAATWAAYSRRIPVAHVEAGLRSGSHESPFPEEGIRKAIGQLATYHFAPTGSAAWNLRDEGVRDGVFITGNTVIDEVKRLTSGATPPAAAVQNIVRAKIRALVLVTCHRREGWDTYLPKVCGLVKRLSPKHHYVVWPVHPNPSVAKVVEKALRGSKHELSEPMAHDVFVRLLNCAKLVITDSGGVIEEAAYLGTPTMIMRERTERHEAVASGTAVMVPPTATVAQMVAMADELIKSGRRKHCWEFGSGHAGEEIATILSGLVLTEAAKR